MLLRATASKSKTSRARSGEAIATGAGEAETGAAAGACADWPPARPLEREQRGLAARNWRNRRRAYTDMSVDRVYPRTEAKRTEARRRTEQGSGTSRKCEKRLGTQLLGAGKGVGSMHSGRYVSEPLLT